MMIAMIPPPEPEFGEQPAALGTAPNMPRKMRLAITRLPPCGLLSSGSPRPKIVSGDALDRCSDFVGFEHALPIVAHQRGLAEGDRLLARNREHAGHMLEDTRPQHVHGAKQEITGPPLRPQSTQARGETDLCSTC